MLTRLKVQGFKNLADVDTRFGPFTCIAGANGVGKSNLFDAIFFLSALANKPLLDAALSVRDESGKTGDVRSLFLRVGDRYANQMSFEAEMIVPLEGTDDLGQKAVATITFLRYSLKLGHRKDSGAHPLGSLEILEEKLDYIGKGEAHKHLLFRQNVAKWRRSAVTGQSSGHRTAPFISTEKDGTGAAIIKIHQDGGSSGKPRSLLASSLPRTVLSTANAAEGPTATMARREMQSWRLLQLEPSSLRRSDPFTAPTKLGLDGSHLAATLYHLARAEVEGERDESRATPAVYDRIANRLAELIGDVRSVTVDRDDRRELLTVTVTGRDGTSHPARALSDGTLRFLALSVLEADPHATGLLCLEEPENGIHPARIGAILSLLESIAVDTSEEIGPDNPLRQVIVNTHSPRVVAGVREEDVLFAELKEKVLKDGKRFKRLSFSCLSGTWRAATGDAQVVSKGLVLEYWSPGYPFDPQTQRERRVCQRQDLQQLSLGFGDRK